MRFQRKIHQKKCVKVEHISTKKKKENGETKEQGKKRARMINLMFVK